MESQLQQFYDDQIIFITGGTGFLDKLLIEKLLRSTNCKTIFVLIREKNGNSASDRLKQLFEDVVFDRLKSERFDYAKRIRSINGDCMFENLGLQQEDEAVLMHNVNIVFHVAATIRLNADLRTSFFMNVRATSDMIELCKKMPQLKSIVHVSTAYAHCYRDRIDERFYDVPFDYQEMSNLLENLDNHQITERTSQIIGKWSNTYLFTKALAEDVIRKGTNQQLPIGIFRPGLIVPTYQQPTPGWVNSQMGAISVISAALCGIARIYGVDGNDFADLTPVDYCCDALIAMAWGIANYKRSTDQSPPIYNYVSSVDNPITWGEYFALSIRNARNYPTIKSVWVPKLQTIHNAKLLRLLRIILHIIPAFFLDNLLILIGRKRRFAKIYESLHAFNDFIRDGGVRSWQFSNNNITQLIAKLNCKDKELFQFDIKTVQWLTYMRSLIKGVRVHQLKDSLHTLNDARTRLLWLQLADFLLTFSLYIFGFFIIYFAFLTIF